MNLNEKYWQTVCAYIPAELKKEIEQEQWVCSYPKKAKMTTLLVIIKNGEKKTVPAEEINKNWFITPFMDKEGEQTKCMNLTHVSGLAIIHNLKNRRDILRLWAKIKEYIKNIAKVEDFSNIQNFSKLQLTVRDFKDRH